MTLHSDTRSVATGIVTEGARTYLVINRHGEGTGTVGSEGLRFQVPTKGYWLVDLVTGLKKRGLTRKSMTMEYEGQASTIVLTDWVQSQY